MTGEFGSVEGLQAAFAEQGYLADVDLATALFLSLTLGRPLFLEGEAGVGKTEVARTLARATGGELIRLQCYEGIDAATALYEWDYPRQMLEVRLLEARGEAASAKARDIFGREFLVRRPLLKAIEGEGPVPPVLLIDEIDRADEPFEAYLLEVLSDYQITVPELGTITTANPPMVIITSNRTREIRDALKRRCLYHWVEFPDARRELEIVRVRAPKASAALSRQVVEFVQRARQVDLFKRPGVAETIDWVNALTALNVLSLEPDAVKDTLGVLLKYQEDVAKVMDGDAARILDELRAAAILK